MIWGCFRASVRRIKRAAGRELSLCCWELGVRHPVSCCSAQTLLEKLFPLLFLAPHSLPALNIRYTNTHNRPARPHRQHRTTTHLLPPPPLPGPRQPRTSKLPAQQSPSSPHTGNTSCATTTRCVLCSSSSCSRGLQHGVHAYATSAPVAAGTAHCHCSVACLAWNRVASSRLCDPLAPTHLQVDVRPQQSWQGRMRHGRPSRATQVSSQS